MRALRQKITWKRARIGHVASARLMRRTVRSAQALGPHANLGAVAAGAAQEVALEQVRRDRRHPVDRVDAVLGLGQTVGVDVGGEDAGVPRRWGEPGLGQDHRERVWFLATRARRRPQAKPLLAAALGRGPPRRRPATRQVFEMVRLAEEVGLCVVMALMNAITSPAPPPSGSVRYSWYSAKVVIPRARRRRPSRARSRWRLWGPSVIPVCSRTRSRKSANSPSL